MQVKRLVWLVAVAAVFGGWLSPLMAQGADKYVARLSAIPVAGPNDRPNVTGKGSVTATLAGMKLTFSGTFEGLPASATIVQLHRGVAKGARGAVITDLMTTKAASGTITGSVDLSAADVDALK